MSASTAMSDLPPAAIIALSTLLVTITLAPVGWLVQRYYIQPRTGHLDPMTASLDTVPLAETSLSSERNSANNANSSSNGSPTPQATQEGAHSVEMGSE
ncbi:hypothetical protein F5Y14DRAFT_398460 [Nemania sp. NC0429]|nr:hypothetical protein F5Y14DRAFT_398460 [Nemania sp. NC0429]